jgi:hypothetical protein
VVQRRGRGQGLADRHAAALEKRISQPSKDDAVALPALKD